MKSFYGIYNGIPFRVSADKRPDKETTAALLKLIEAASKMKFKKRK